MIGQRRWWLRAAVVVLASTSLALPASAGGASLRHVPGVAFAEHDGAVLRYDVLRPDDGVRRPAVVLVHGGGWWRGGRDDLRVARPLAQVVARAGMVAVTIDYRLACSTEARPRRAFGVPYDFASDRCGAEIPEQVADVRAAVAHARSRAGTLGIDQSRIALLGVSAGGHLALLAALGAGAEDPRVRAVVDISGPTATGFIRRQPARPVAPVRTIRASFTNAIGCHAADCPDRWLAADPLARITEPGAGRFALLAMGGASETQVPAATTAGLVRANARRGLRSELVAVPGSCHGTGCAFDRHTERGIRPMGRVLAFLRGVLGVSSTARLS